MYVAADNKTHALTRIILGQTPDDDVKRREAFIQDLIHDHPSLIPMVEIEPAFTPLISVCKELPTPAGYLDNLWITPWGGLVLGEAKLIRNPQSRREVVAQALDYARALTGWTYEDLQDAVRKALGVPSFTLWSLVEVDSDLSEDQFVDAVQRRLSTGRLMLLIIGDGIQEGVEALTEHLQLHAGLHVGLALLELSLWRGVDGGLFVVPRVPMRTVLIERGVVRIETGAARIDPPRQAALSPRQASGKPHVATASESEFFDHMAAKRPELVAIFQAALSEMVACELRPDIGKTLKLTFATGPDSTANAGIIESNGTYWSQGAARSAIRLGRPEAGETYQARVAELVGGQVRRYEKSPPEVLGPNGRAVDVASLLQSRDDWLSAIKDFVQALSVEGNPSA